MFSVLVRQNNIIWINFFALEYFILEFFVNFDLGQIHHKIINIISKYDYLVFIDLLFLAFLYFNKFSLVLGDKTSHEFSFHLAQINHFLFFILFFFPYLNMKIFNLFSKEFYSQGKLKQFIFTFLIIVISMLILNRFSFTHDFLLADNRHSYFLDFLVSLLEVYCPSHFLNLIQSIFYFY